MLEMILIVDFKSLLLLHYDKIWPFEIYANETKQKLTKNVLFLR